MKKFITFFTLAGALVITSPVFGQDSKVAAPAKPKAATGLQSSPAPAKKANPMTGTVAQAVPTTKIKFAETKHDFGKIKQGDVVKHTFKFTNAGENPLILKEVRPSCGCTALEWPREAIAPGESAEIEAQFNSRGKMGKQNKYFTIRYNGAPEIERVAFTGEVIPAPKPAAKPVVQPAPKPVNNTAVKKETVQK